MKKQVMENVGAVVTKNVGVAGKYVIQNLNPLEVLREFFKYREVVENQLTERERIIAKRDIAITAIQSEKELILKYFELRFAERREALGHLFDVLHEAVELKNEKLLDTALTGILGIVKDNPLRDFEAFRNSRVKGEIIEL